MKEQYAICTLSMMPVRSEPAHRSEMVNMLLLGDVFRIEETVNDWHRIYSCLDDYCGWITARKLMPVDEVYRMKLENEKPVFMAAPFGKAQGQAQEVQLTLGSRLPLYKEGEFVLGTETYRYDGPVHITEKTTDGAAMVQQALAYLQTPYLWGGRSLFGIDCSGLTQMVYHLAGIGLPRDAWQQAEKGTGIPSLAEAQAGDLAFFAEKERISHVGILTGDGYMIHASGQVRKDWIDEKGIFNGEIQQYTLPVKCIRRYLGAE